MMSRIRIRWLDKYGDPIVDVTGEQAYYIGKYSGYDPMHYDGERFYLTYTEEE